MEAVQNTGLAERLIEIRDQARPGGQEPNLTSVAALTGINRVIISGIANGTRVATPEQADKLWRVLDDMDTGRKPEREMDSAALTTPTAYKHKMEIYKTEQYQEAMGWCGFIQHHRKMGVMIGHPGSGKTTVLRAFCENTGAHYIECWPMMLAGDLLGEIAAAIGIALSNGATVFQQMRQVTQALARREDVTLIFDEAEHLKEDKNGVKKIEMLRKIWDNTGTPIILADTQKLRKLITRGGGRDNLAQLYRREYTIELTGIKPKEVRSILREYNLDAWATEKLVEIATDIPHGGMGTFAEVLGMCLNEADGARINEDILKGVARYKLTY